MGIEKIDGILIEEILHWTGNHGKSIAGHVPIDENKIAISEDLAESGCLFDK